MPFAVNATLPVKTLAELVAYAKANPGKVTFASPGYGTGPHLAGELFKRVAGIELGLPRSSARRHRGDA